MSVGSRLLGFLLSLLMIIGSSPLAETSTAQVDDTPHITAISPNPGQAILGSNFVASFHVRYDGTTAGKVMVFVGPESGNYFGPVIGQPQCFSVSGIASYNPKLDFTIPSPSGGPQSVGYRVWARFQPTSTCPFMQDSAAERLSSLDYGIEWQSKPSGLSASGQVTDTSGQPIEGVTISLNTGSTTTTDSGGNFTFWGLIGGSYTFTPSKAGYTFSPPSIGMSIAGDITNLNFRGTAGPPASYSIAGTIRDRCGASISGVTVSTGDAGSATTDAAGNYKIEGLRAGSYTLTPSKSGYSFEPPILSVSGPPDITGKDFVASGNPNGPALTVTPDSVAADNKAEAHIILSGTPVGHNVRILSSREKLDILSPAGGLVSSTGCFSATIKSSAIGRAELRILDLTTNQLLPPFAQLEFVDKTNSLTPNNSDITIEEVRSEYPLDGRYLEGVPTPNHIYVKVNWKETSAGHVDLILNETKTKTAYSTDNGYTLDIDLGRELWPGKNVLQIIAINSAGVRSLSRAYVTWSTPLPIWMAGLMSSGLASPPKIVAGGQLSGELGYESGIHIPPYKFDIGAPSFGFPEAKTGTQFDAAFHLSVPLFCMLPIKGTASIETEGSFNLLGGEFKPHFDGNLTAQPIALCAWELPKGDFSFGVEGTRNLYRKPLLIAVSYFNAAVGIFVEQTVIILHVEELVAKVLGEFYIDGKIKGGLKVDVDIINDFPYFKFSNLGLFAGFGLEGGYRYNLPIVEIKVWVGGEGEGRFAIAAPDSSLLSFDEVKLTGEVGAKLRAAWFDYEKKGSVEWKYPTSEVQTSIASETAPHNWSLIGHGTYKDALSIQPGHAYDKPFGPDQFAHLANTSIGANILVSNVYTHTESALSINSATNDALLLWVHDDINKPVGQAHEIYFSRWNGSTWSVPAGVTNDNLLDSSPQVAWTADGRAVAIWQRLNMTLRSDATATAKIFKKIEIATATYDPVSNTWSPATLLTNNSSLDMQPQLVRGADGRLMGVWRQNRAGSLGGDTVNPDQVMVAFYDNGWSKPVVAVKDIGGLIDLAAGYGNGTATIAFTRFVRSGGSSQPTLQLFTSIWDGKKWSKPVQRSRAGVDYRNPQVIYNAANQPLVSALAGTELHLINLTTSVVVSQTLSPEIGGVDEFRLVQDRLGNIAAVFAAQAEQRDLYLSFYDQAHNLWGLPTRLTNDRASEGYLAPAIDSTGRLVMAYAATAINTEVHAAISSSGTISYTMPVEGQTDLMVLAHTFGKNVSLTDLNISDEHPAPGATVVLSATLKNTGDQALDGTTVNFYDGDPSAGGALIGSAQWPTPLVAGATATLTTTYNVPTTGGARLLYAVADPAGTVTESDESDNKASRAAFGPDLEIAAAKVDYWGDRNVGLITQIRNHGTVASPATTLRFYQDTITGTLVTSDNVPALLAGQAITLTTPWNYGSLGAGTHRLVAIVNLSDFQEIFSDNNSRDLKLDNRADLMVSSAYLWTTSRTEPTVAITTTVFNTGPVEAHDVTVGFYRDERLDYRSLIFTRTLTLMPAGGAIQVNGTASGPLPCGVYVVVDPEQRLNEVSREDNLAAITGAPLLRRIYGVSETQDRDSQLFTLDPQSHTITLIGSVLTGYDIEGIAAHPATDILYAASNRHGVNPGALYTVDKQTGALTLIGNTGFRGISDLAFRPTDGTLWGWVEGGGLIQIDIATGLGTLVYKSSQSVEAMSWGWDGSRLYIGTGKRLLAFDPASRTMTETANNLPRNPEALLMQPDGTLLGSADDVHQTLFAYAISELQPIDSQKITVPFKDVEALTWSESCS